ncbi:hypothetical protein AMAG_09415 [Allomyces macrogynus ATCC 38327]|uniref:TAP42-like protein n=1 Tax=Allomyces macrogynus (strain ATCC 38327) TaxID=578462 RepID=A0A0L0SPE6_ALLM3|nr:hypothetical protein AMAG_09415 [Allomyces macrogynus ATCC 38327]|eukprot:KNE64391.1 hypothetical protein AMAG_09415 [Allomyces macrogynus ATCC 38327]
MISASGPNAGQNDDIVNPLAKLALADNDGDVATSSPHALFLSAVARLADASADDAAARAAVARLTTCADRVHAQRLFSTNEALDDVKTTDLPLLLVHAYLADAYGRLRTDGPQARLATVKTIQSQFQQFMTQCDTYDLIPRDERSYMGAMAPPAAAKLGGDQRRDFKIARFKASRQRESLLAERAAQLGDFATRRGAAAMIAAAPSLAIATGISVTTTTSAQPTAAAAAAADDADADLSGDDEAVARDFYLLLVRHWIAKAVDELINLQEERAHLDRMVQEPPRRPQPSSSSSSADRLDGPPRQSIFARTGPLLDKGGRPLRPFTITSQRAALQDQVFRPGHRLPTMSLDEYLEAEMARGGILPRAEPAPAKNESDDDDEDSDRDEVADRKLYKARNWDAFTDDNPRGWGNRGGNRG